MLGGLRQLVVGPMDFRQAEQNLVMARVLLSVGALTVLAVGSYRRLGHWHPGFRRHFPTLWPRSQQTRGELTLRASSTTAECSCPLPHSPE